MKRLITLVVAMSLSALCVFSKGVKHNYSENMKAGMAIVDENGDLEEAFNYFQKEIADNPNNGYAHYWIGYIRKRYNNYKGALEDYQRALVKIPSKDVEYLKWVCNDMSELYWASHDTSMAFASVNAALELDSKFENAYCTRAALFFELGEYDKSDVDYATALKLNPDHHLPVMGLGRNQKLREKYAEAIEIFTKVSERYPNYADAYSFRAECYYYLKDYEKATDDLIQTYVVSVDDNRANYVVGLLDSVAQDMLLSKMKQKAIENQDDNAWPYYMGKIYVYRFDYENAIRCFSQSMDVKFNGYVSRLLAYSYNDFGDEENALKYADLAIKLDSSDNKAMTLKCNILYEMGKYQEGLDLSSELLKKNPRSAVGFEKRAFGNSRLGNYKEAESDYSLALLMVPGDSYYWVRKAQMHKKMGEEKKYNNDLKKAVSLDSMVRNVYTTYCLAYLGEKEKAIAGMDSLTKDYKSMVEKYYFYTCLYSILDNKALSMHYFKKSLDAGLVGLKRFEDEEFLENLRKHPGYKSLVAEYTKKINEKVEALRKSLTSKTPESQVNIRISEEDKLQ